MIIDFSKIDAQQMPNFKGGEKGLLAKMFSDEQNKIIRARLIAGATVGEHKHDTGSEIIFALSGQATATTDGVEERLTAGDCHYCPKGHGHTLKNDGPEDFVFVAVVVQQ